MEEDAASVDQSHQSTSWSEQRGGVIPFRSGSCCTFKSHLCSCNAKRPIDVSESRGHFCNLLCPVHIREVYSAAAINV